jgi:hypothetical protein
MDARGIVRNDEWDTEGADRERHGVFRLLRHRRHSPDEPAEPYGFLYRRWCVTIAGGGISGLASPTGDPWASDFAKRVADPVALNSRIRPSRLWLEAVLAHFPALEP